jgi:hypothetical protein
VSGSMPLVLDLHITHERWGSRSHPSINGHLRYPNDIDRSLNESVTDKIRKYHTGYNNNDPNVVSLIPPIVSTSVRLHGELVFLLFLQVHRKTDPLFCSFRTSACATQPVPLPSCVVFRRSSQVESKIGNILAKVSVLRIMSFV